MNGRPDWPRFAAATSAAWGGYACVVTLAALLGTIGPPPAELPVLSFGFVFWFAAGCPLGLAALIAVSGGPALMRQGLWMAVAALGWLVLCAGMALVESFTVFRPLHEAMGAAPSVLAALQYLVVMTELPWIGLLIGAVAVPRVSQEAGNSRAITICVAAGGAIGAAPFAVRGFGLARVLAAGWGHAGTLTLYGLGLLLLFALLCGTGVVSLRTASERTRRRGVLVTAGTGLAGGLVAMLCLYRVVEAMFAPTTQFVPPAGGADLASPEVFADAVTALGVVLPFPLPIGVLAAVALIAGRHAPADDLSAAPS